MEVPNMRKVVLAGLIGASALAFSAMSASAAIVCTGDVCWHTHDSYDYPPSAGVVVHEDNWAPGPSVTFREHEGRGYWHGDSWTAW
jgi:hypothetical protein